MSNQIQYNLVYVSILCLWYYESAAKLAKSNSAVLEVGYYTEFYYQGIANRRTLAAREQKLIASWWEIVKCFLVHVLRERGKRNHNPNPQSYLTQNVLKFLYAFMFQNRF